MPRHCRGALLALTLAFALVPVRAQVPVQDLHYNYYDSRPPASNQLATVEKNHFGKGMNRMDAGEWDLAMAEWDFILRYFPNHPRVLYLMSLTAEETGERERAEDYFKTAFQLYPNTATTYSVYGIILYRRGNLDDAVEAFQQSLMLDPGSAEAHYNLGITYAEAGRRGDANRHAQAAYRLGYPLPGLRERLRRTGDWKELPAEELAALVSSQAN